MRILLDQYAKFGAFAFRTKAETSMENRKLQQETHHAERCETRKLHATPSTVHVAENDHRLPELIRGGHYIHFRHFCAVLGCEHAPYDQLSECFSRLGELINPFPILCKDTEEHIQSLINKEPLLSKRRYSIKNVNVKSLFVDGCFWHGHDCRNTHPKEHSEFWELKRQKNIAHDKEITELFENRGWIVIRIWECEFKKKNASKLDEKLKVIKETNDIF